MLDYITIAHSAEIDHGPITHQGVEMPNAELTEGWYLLRTTEPDGGEFEVIAGPFTTDYRAMAAGFMRGFTSEQMQVAA